MVEKVRERKKESERERKKEIKKEREKERETAHPLPLQTVSSWMAFSQNANHYSGPRVLTWAIGFIN